MLVASKRCLCLNFAAAYPAADSIRRDISGTVRSDNIDTVWSTPLDVNVQVDMFGTVVTPDTYNPAVDPPLFVDISVDTVPSVVVS